jgi:hypothetical protein
MLPRDRQGRRISFRSIAIDAKRNGSHFGGVVEL